MELYRAVGEKQEDWAKQEDEEEQEDAEEQYG